MTRWVLRCMQAGLACLVLASGSEAAPVMFAATLSGAAESPPNASGGTGTALVTFDVSAHTMQVQVTFSNLQASTTASHIHAATASPGTGTAGVATTTPSFPGFPLGVTSGTYDQTFDLTLLSSYNPAYVTANGNTAAGAEAALFAALNAGEAYLNIHTSAFPAGEIRGFLTPVPEPGSLVLIGLGGALVVLTRAWKRTSASE